MGGCGGTGPGELSSSRAPSHYSPTFGDTGPVMSPRTRRPFLVDVNGQIVSNGLQLQWTYSTALHEEATIVRLANRVSVLLEEIAG